MHCALFSLSYSASSWWIKVETWTSFTFLWILYAFVAVPLFFPLNKHRMIVQTGPVFCGVFFFLLLAFNLSPFFSTFVFARSIFRVLTHFQHAHRVLSHRQTSMNRFLFSYIRTMCCDMFLHFLNVLRTTTVYDFDWNSSFTRKQMFVDVATVTLHYQAVILIATDFIFKHCFIIQKRSKLTICNPDWATMHNLG